MKEKIIYTRWLAYELRKAGCRILRKEINPNSPELNCWVFEKTEAFNRAFEEIMNK